MPTKDRREVIMISRWEKIPFLIHGFGTKNWKMESFKKNPEWRNFRLLSLKQTHSDIIRFINKIPDKKLEGDAMASNLRGILLIIKTADCLPVLLFDRSKMVVAAVHCGWRGTCENIAQKTVQKLKDLYGCDPSSLLASLGPSIGKDCYEVGEDVYRCFKKKSLSLNALRKHPFRPGKYLLDLKKANRAQLAGSGMKQENIISVELCPHCEKDLISYRRDKNTRDRMLNFIGLSN